MRMDWWIKRLIASLFGLKPIKIKRISNYVCKDCGFPKGVNYICACKTKRILFLCEFIEGNGGVDNGEPESEEMFEVYDLSPTK